MSKLLTFLFCSLALSTVSLAQIATPQPSPSAILKQSVGLTEFTVEYSRPSMKDRTIFAEDGLVPYDQIWRTGANNATIIEFTEDIKFGGEAVEAGSYAVYSVPGKSSWEVMLYSDLTLGGYVGNYDKANEVLRISAKSGQMESSVESFTIEFDNLRDGSASLMLLWENTWVEIPIEVHTHDQIMASIDKFAENPMADVAGNYLNSGWYIYSNGGDKATALEYLDKGCEYTSSPYLFYYMQRKAVVQAAMGDYKGAVATAKVAHEKGMKAPANAKAFYDDTVKAELDAHIEEWSAKM